MIDKILKVLNKLSILFFDVRIIKTSDLVKDLRKITSNPITASYYSPLSSFIIDVELSKLRIGKWFKVNDLSYSPLVFCTKCFFNNDRNLHILIENLEKYTESIDLDNANKVMGIKENNSSYSSSSHPFSAVMPWEKLTPEEKFIKRSKSVKKENNQKGLNTIESLSYNATSDKVYVEAKRLKGILDSITTKGFILDSKDMIQAIVLVNKNDYRFLISAGQHRIAVLSVLNYETIPIQLNGIIRREDVLLWPNVVSGLYSKQVAIDIFDRCFEAVIPSSFQKWERYVDKSEKEL